MLIWELVGAVVGAGLASGREIASFFSKYGGWSFVGIGTAVCVMICLADTELPLSWRGRWPHLLWRTLLALLLIATGGAMLSGAGEVAAMTVPIVGASGWGMAGTLFLAWLLSSRTISGLAWVSRLLMVVLAVLIVLGLRLPPMKAAAVERVNIPEAIFRAAAYGGFNAALQMPLLQQREDLSVVKKRHAVMGAGGVTVLLLLLGNGVLLRHPALLGKPMPFISMVSHLGKPGFWLGAACLYLAILSTLTACMRGLGRKLYPLFAIGLIAMLGFTGVVEVAYPLLGGGCFLMLAAAKFRNCFANPFHSRHDMV